LAGQVHWDCLEEVVQQDREALFAMVATEAEMEEALSLQMKELDN